MKKKLLCLLMLVCFLCTGCIQPQKPQEPLSTAEDSVPLEPSYQLVTVTELLTSDGGTINAGKLYYNR